MFPPYFVPCVLFICGWVFSVTLSTLFLLFRWVTVNEPFNNWLSTTLETLSTSTKTVKIVKTKGYPMDNKTRYYTPHFKSLEAWSFLFFQARSASKFPFFFQYVSFHWVRKSHQIVENLNFPDKNFTNSQILNNCLF